MALGYGTAFERRRLFGAQGRLVQRHGDWPAILVDGDHAIAGLQDRFSICAGPA